MNNNGKKHIIESKDYSSKHASSWYVGRNNVGPTSYVSLTFVDFVQKVRVDHNTLQMTGSSDLIAEALCNITLTDESAKNLAYVILGQLGIFHER